LRNESFKKGFGPRYNDLRKYVEMSERFLTTGVVVEESLGDKLPQERIDELNEICNFARINYVFKASKTAANKNKKKRRKNQTNKSN
jgi:3-deoxy-D-manno-octulosonic acid (KDO) 8-phosphate synthase